MNLMETAKRNMHDRIRWLREAEEARALVELLPKEIQELDGSADCDSDMKLVIRLFGGDEALETCSKAGATFDEPKMSSYGGKFAVDGTIGDIVIRITELSVPERCHVEREEYTAFRYKAICNETGEEVQ